MIQIIKYKCCGVTFAACAEPECYIDTEWLKDLTMYAKRGDKIEMVERGSLKLGSCECKKIDLEQPIKTIPPPPLPPNDRTWREGTEPPKPRDR